MLRRRVALALRLIALWCMSAANSVDQGEFHRQFCEAFNRHQN